MQNFRALAQTVQKLSLKHFLALLHFYEGSRCGALWGSWGLNHWSEVFWSLYIIGSTSAGESLWWRLESSIVIFGVVSTLAKSGSHLGQRGDWYFDIFGVKESFERLGSLYLIDRGGGEDHSCEVSGSWCQYWWRCDLLKLWLDGGDGCQGDNEWRWKVKVLGWCLLVIACTLRGVGACVCVWTFLVVGDMWHMWVWGVILVMWEWLVMWRWWLRTEQYFWRWWRLSVLRAGVVDIELIVICTARPLTVWNVGWLLCYGWDTSDKPPGTLGGPCICSVALQS